MANEITQGGRKASSYNEIEEHAVINGVHGKKVFVVDAKGNQVSGFGGTFDNYEYMGTDTVSSASYKYIGFKEYGTTNWKVMRISLTDSTDVAYSYGTTGWTTAWSDPTALSFNDPPDE